MQAQHHNAHLSRSVQAQVARLVLQANLAYGESNSNGLSYIQRLKARNECREHLNQALALEADNAAALGLLGRVEMDDGELEKAHALFNASLNRQPAQAQQYCNLGYWALKSERPALAEEYFLQALECDRQSAAAFCGVAHAKRLQGQFDVAYLHYRKLLQSGSEWDSVYSGMLSCAQHLQVHKADSDLALDAIALLGQEGLPHQEIGHFVGAIIQQQYDLDNPNAEIFLDAAAEDELLILALQKTLMPNAAAEELVVLLRRAIMAEVAQTASLRDELQPLCLAIAEYADRTGFALAAEDDEERLAATINESIMAQFAVGEPQEALIGSVMISAMYGALFHQNFAAQLGQWNLVDWPLAMQPIMAASYYNRAEEEAIKQNFDEKAEELCLEKTDVPQAWPAWSQLAYRTETNLKAVMAQELGLNTDNLPAALRIMVCGAQSGQRAMELANRQDTLWTELLKDEDFYSLGGCRDRWFRPQDANQLKELLALVSNEVEWKLVKARDEDDHSLAQIRLSMVLVSGSFHVSESTGICSQPC